MQYTNIVSDWDRKCEKENCKPGANMNINHAKRGERTSFRNFPLPTDALHEFRSEIKISRCETLGRTPSYLSRRMSSSPKKKKRHPALPDLCERIVLGKGARVLIRESAQGICPPHHGVKIGRMKKEDEREDGKQRVEGRVVENIQP